MSSLNPAFTIGDQIAEAIVSHRRAGGREALKLAAEMLDLVGIPMPSQRLRDYPHQMSGGMRQRVMIAIALACRPNLLIADEPTTALDVTVQAQILELMRKLQDEFGMAVLFITHNLGVVAEVADRVVVMYGGRIVEEAWAPDLFKKSKHPYTRGLLNSLPMLHASAEGNDQNTRLVSIPGTPPSPFKPPPGCPFEPRCALAIEPCREFVPELESVGEGHWARCIRHREM
jgi:oligopeptide/dipeptide ABC transporter ATP-binding protein